MIWEVDCARRFSGLTTWRPFSVLLLWIENANTSPRSPCPFFLFFFLFVRNSVRHITLEVVFPIRTRLPDIENGAWYPFTREVPDCAMHERYASALGRGIDDDALAQLAKGCVGRPKGPEDGGRCWVGACFGYDFVGNFVDQSSYTQQKSDQPNTRSLTLKVK